jgi:hypothetical protein
MPSLPNLFPPLTKTAGLVEGTQIFLSKPARIAIKIMKAERMAR